MAPSPLQNETRAGYVSLIGLPNAGKSSLLNQLVQRKLSIVTPAAQTTRERVLGIDTRDGVQAIFVDTPGLVQPSYLLHHAMRETAMEAIQETDAVVLVVDATDGIPALDPDVIALLRGRHRSVVVVANKVDRAVREQVEAVRRWVAEEFGATFMETSATRGSGIDELRATLASHLPVSPFFFPPDELSSQPVRFFVAELIRETIFEMYREEVPYSTVVRTEEFREDDIPIYIRATVYVERPTQKGVLIGRGGAAIKRLGQESRRKIEDFLDSPVYLDLWIKVLPKWRKDAQTLQRLGFSVPNVEK